MMAKLVKVPLSHRQVASLFVKDNMLFNGLKSYRNNDPFAQSGSVSAFQGFT
jgi:hypothetical protein